MNLTTDFEIFIEIVKNNSYSDVFELIKNNVKNNSFVQLYYIYVDNEVWYYNYLFFNEENKNVFQYISQTLHEKNILFIDDNEIMKLKKYFFQTGFCDVIFDLNWTIL